MSWLPWRRPSPIPVVAPPTPPVEAEVPAPPMRSLLEKVAYWRRIFAEQRAAQPTREQLDQAEATVQAQRQAAREDEFARSIARKGYVWPGESADDDGPSSRGAGVWMGDVWAQRQLEDAMDWTAEVRAKQAQEIEDGA
jgi:hypothetical protein